MRMKRDKTSRHVRRTHTDKEAVRCDIDDEIIELHALDRLTDKKLREHLDSCVNCRARVTEYRAVLAGLRKAMEDLERRKDRKKRG
jgi:hypothetical protein